MRDTRVTVASLRSILIDPSRNLDLVKKACEQAAADGARLLVLPELMLTGHGGHPKMTENAEPVPDGPLSQEILALSKEHDLCICVGIAELSHKITYNSQMVADKGEYLGLQRKIYLSNDEYCHFGQGDRLEVFDIGDIRFGISICHDNEFPEMAMLHGLNGVDLLVAAVAARTGEWPEELTPEFYSELMRKQQKFWDILFRPRARDHNLFVLVSNAVGPSTEGLENVVANHAGGVMAVAPGGEVFLETSASSFVDEVVTVTLEEQKQIRDHTETRNRRPEVLQRLLQDAMRRQE